MKLLEKFGNLPPGVSWLPGTREGFLRVLRLKQATKLFVRLRYLFPCTVVTLLTVTANAQIDPEARNLLQLGINQSLHDDGPPAAYAFYYWNMPDVPSTVTHVQ